MDPAYLPLQRGFDTHYGHYNGALDYFTHVREGGHDWHRIDEPLHMVDIYPTLLGLAGDKVDQQKSLDGKDAWPTIPHEKESPHDLILLNVTPFGGAIWMGGLETRAQECSRGRRDLCFRPRDLGAFQSQCRSFQNHE